MKYLFLLTVLFSTHSIFAQQKVHSSKKNAINITSGVAFGYRLEGADFEQLKKRSTLEYIPAVDQTAIISANFRFGIDYQRQLIHNLSIKMGARLANWNLSYEPNKITKEERKGSYLFIEIPITLNYKFGNKRLQPYVELGSSPMIFLQNKSEYSYSTPPTFSVAIHAGIGLSYQFTETFSLFGQISGRFQTESFSIYHKRFNDLLYPYEIGLELGAAFYF